LTHLKKGPRNRIFRWSSSDFGHEKPAYSVESQKNPISASYFSRVNFGTELTAFGGFGLSDVPGTAPVTAVAWFSLLQSGPFLGLVLFDIVNYLLVGVMFLALYGALRHVNRGVMVMAMACTLIGVGVYLASNQAFAMLSLSRQHAAAGQ
jgi:uncharacterized membrane protein YcfT